MNPWLRGGNWSYGASAGLACAEHPLGAKAFATEAQAAMKEHLRLAFEMNGARSAQNCERYEPKWLYRLESQDPSNGLWYDSTGRLVWGIGKLPDCKTKDLPMGYDERYRQDGRAWFSSCSKKEDLTHWYSLQDALDLIAHGFVFTRYLATEYVEYDLETVFIKETCLKREEINIEELFGKEHENV